MDNYHSYAKAPITEALIALQVESPTEDIGGAISLIQKELLPEYSVLDNLLLHEGIVQHEGLNVKTSSQQKWLGLRLSSKDSKKILQARLDGLTLSQLQPYESWDALRDEAQRL